MLDSCVKALPTLLVATLVVVIASDSALVLPIDHDILTALTERYRLFTNSKGALERHEFGS